MLHFIYNILILILEKALNIFGVFSDKLLKGIKGRRNTFKILENNIKKGDKTIWFHCASLGEYEQGLPVFSEIQKDYPNHKIVLSFFSPSGYEIRNKNPITNIVVYLPIDTKSNAKRFIQFLKPELTVFVKYDIWPNYLHELKKENLNAILISALFRKKQSYFKFYGTPLRKALFAFNHIFTQNLESKILLESIGLKGITVSGDTRFDRVFSQLKVNNSLDFIEEFKNDQICIVAGSTWPEDEKLLVNFINNYETKNTKFIIAPHNIKQNLINDLKKELNTKVVIFSDKDNESLKDFNVLIIDTIGLLSKIYIYANIAYVGGAMGNTGLHNTLEPAVFGIPIIIGNHYNNFPEAFDMINNKGMYSISNQDEFNSVLHNLIHDPSLRETSGKANSDYIEKNKGAVIQIMSYLRK